MERLADRLFHDPLESDEVREVRAWVRGIAQRDLTEHATRLANADEVEDGFPFAAFQAMADAGLFRIPDGSADGRSLAGPVAATAAAIEEIAYVSSSLAAIFDVHCILAGRSIARGTDSVREAWLEPLIRGDAIGAFATSEPQASTDLRPSAQVTEAIPEDGGYLVRGHKRWITNSPVASVIVTLCKTADGRSVLLAVPIREGDPVSIGRPDRKIGNRGQITADVRFDGVFVPADHVIGEPGQGMREALRTLTYGRIGIGAAGVGMAQAGLEAMVRHLKRRQVFGQSLARFQHWQFRVAELATEIDTARNLYLRAAWRLDRGIEFPEPQAAMAKMRGSSVAVDVAREAVQCLGGLGYVRELGATGEPGEVEFLYRDSKVGEIYEGTNEIQKLIIAREIFGRELTG